MSTKIKSLSAFNFAGYSNIMINLDQNINYLIGPNGAGKTIAGLDIVWFVMQGIAEKSSDGKIPLLGDRFRFIGSEGATALAELVLHDSRLKCDIRVIRKLTKTGTELSFSAPLGMELDQQWLNDLFNIFLISPKRFVDLSSREQSIALGINTKEFDDKIAELKAKLTLINRDLSKYDNLDEVELVSRPDLDALQAEKLRIKERISAEIIRLQDRNKSLRRVWESSKKAIDKSADEHNKKVNAELKVIRECIDANFILMSHGCVSGEVEKFIKDLREKNEDLIMEDQIADLYPPEPEYVSEIPDDKDLVDIDQRILEAAGQNERALLYEQYIEKLRIKGDLELQLKQNKADQAELYAKRLEYIKSFKFPFSSLSVDDDGGLLLNDKPLKPAYFSSGELLRIVPSLIASKQPDFKYVFIQEANLIDEKNLAAIEKELTEQGFQLVFELVGKTPVVDRSCIMLKDRKVISAEFNQIAI